MNILQWAFALSQIKCVLWVLAMQFSLPLTEFSCNHLGLALDHCFDYAQHFKTVCTKYLNYFPYHTAKQNENWTV